MTRVRFYDRVDDGLLRYAVIAARAGGRWVFCRHRERDTLELPGGHREPGEDIPVCRKAGTPGGDRSHRIQHPPGLRVLRHLPGQERRTGNIRDAVYGRRQHL